MEIEELMTNRSLLEKMSENDIHSSLRKQPKHVVIQDHHSKPPKDIRLEYKNNSLNNAPVYVENMQPHAQPVVLEGYGCKCPKKLKRLFKILWIMLLVLYIFGMPVVLVHLYTNLADTKIKISNLQNELDTHLKVSQHDVQVKLAKQIDSTTSNKLPKEELEKNYKDLSHFKLRTTRLMHQLEADIKAHERRLSFISSIESWLNETYINLSKTSDKCGCRGLPGRPGLNGIPGIPGRPGKYGEPGVTGPRGKEGRNGRHGVAGQCDCSYVYEGKDGKPGPRGPPGKQAVIDKETLRRIAGLKGELGSRGIKGNIGLPGRQGLPGKNGTCSSCGEKLELRTVYTRWGKSTCPSESNSTAVYNGYMAGSYHTHQGGGTNYLCLPKNPKYNKYDAASNIDDRGYMHGVEFEVDESNIFDTTVKSGQYFDAVCAVCEVKSRSNVLMVPATTVCPTGWTKEYHGYLMAQKKHLRRTEFICVDHRPDLIIGTENWGKGAFLHFVETRCGVLPCRSGYYQENWELACVVCTS